ncbi:MAG: hypothetical protein WBD50_01840 [Candidatus Rhabdochlamydia sp.]
MYLAFSLETRSCSCPYADFSIANATNATTLFSIFSFTLFGQGLLLAQIEQFAEM